MSLRHSGKTQTLPAGSTLAGIPLRPCFAMHSRPIPINFGSRQWKGWVQSKPRLELSQLSCIFEQILAFRNNSKPSSMGLKNMDGTEKTWILQLWLKQRSFPWILTQRRSQVLGQAVFPAPVWEGSRPRLAYDAMPLHQLWAYFHQLQGLTCNSLWNPFLHFFYKPLLHTFSGIFTQILFFSSLNLQKKIK